MNKEIERRLFATDVNIRDSTSQPGEMIVEGYAVVFDSPATHGYTEIITKDALKNCDMSDVPMKYNHEDSFLLLARTKNNSLSLEVDEKGLKVTARLIDTSSNIDIYKSLKAGLLDKMSFAFTVSDETWDEETMTRTINSIDKLYDVSIVDLPFYETTEVFARKYNLESEKTKLNNKRNILARKLKLKLKLDEIKGGI